MWVLRNDDTGKYVTMPGDWHSYTNLVENSRHFASKEVAEREACGNETAYRLDQLPRR